MWILRFRSLKLLFGNFCWVVLERPLMDFEALKSWTLSNQQDPPNVMSKRFDTDVIGDFWCGGAWTSMFKESGFETTISILHIPPWGFALDTNKFSTDGVDNRALALLNSLTVIKPWRQVWEWIYRKLTHAHGSVSQLFLQLSAASHKNWAFYRLFYRAKSITDLRKKKNTSMRHSVNATPPSGSLRR